MTTCSGTNAEISCDFTEVSNPFDTRPDWRIIRRNNDGLVISNETVNAGIIRANQTDGLVFHSQVLTNNIVTVRLSVGPVDHTYNNTSYQCIFTINDTIIESNTAGTVSVIGMYVHINLFVISFIVVAMNSRDRYKIIGLREILHFIKQPCRNIFLEKAL